MKRVFVRYRNRKIEFELPSHWQLLTFADFDKRPPRENIGAMVRNTLKLPVEAAPLKDRLSKDDKIAVLVEDLTRASPKGPILGELLRELESIHVPDHHISIVIALGTHRGLTKKELDGTFGKDVVSRYTFINHDCHASDLVPVGKLKTGTTVKINRHVYESTFKIGIGSIFPHPLNGFGGGSKIMFPAVSDFDSILEHHLKYSFRKGSDLGKIDGNPFYEEVCSLAKSAHLDFIINSVLDHNDRLYDIVCGDPIKAHLNGIKISKEIISRKFEKKADLTLITAFPYSEGPQIMKPLAPASLITKPGGCIILFADCTVPLPDDYLSGCEAFRIKYGGSFREKIFQLFDNNRRIMEGGAPEFNMSMAQALMAQDDFKVILVSEDIPRNKVEQLGFLYAETMEKAFEMSKIFCPAPEVHIVPSGGVILPEILETSQEIQQERVVSKMKSGDLP